MIVFRYDRTFEGLLTVVFDAYSRKSFPERLIGPGEPVPMFAREVLDSTTDPVRAERVWKGLRKKLPRRLRNMLLHVWLSESVGADELLLRYMRKIFDSPERKSADFTDADVLAVHDIARTVSREAHHLIQFARLRKMADGSYYAPVSPKCNALPLAVGYFRDRFADQRWLVYDLKRRYGYAYDLHEVREVVFESLSGAPSERLTDDLLDADELAFQRLWKSYFDALAIPERFNPRLQRRQMPARFWTHMIEMEKRLPPPRESSYRLGRRFLGWFSKRPGEFGFARRERYGPYADIVSKKELGSGFRYPALISAFGKPAEFRSFRLAALCYGGRAVWQSWMRKFFSL